MKEFVISQAQTERAVLVGLITRLQDERKTNEYLDELEFLADTAGAEVVHPEAVRALLGSGVPLIIKSTFGKQCGTLVSCAGCKSAAQCRANGPRETALTMPITTGNGDCEKISPVEAVSGKDGKVAVASPEMNRRTAAAIIGCLARLRIKVVRPKIVGCGCLMFETERDFTERAVVALYRTFAEKRGGAD